MRDRCGLGRASWLSLFRTGTLEEWGQRSHATGMRSIRLSEARANLTMLFDEVVVDSAIRSRRGQCVVIIAQSEWVAIEAVLFRVNAPGFEDGSIE